MDQSILITQVKIDLIREIRRRMNLERDMIGIVTDIDVQNILDQLQSEAEHQARPFAKDPSDAPIVKAMNGGMQND